MSVQNATPHCLSRDHPQIPHTTMTTMNHEPHSNQSDQEEGDWRYWRVPSTPVYHHPHSPALFHSAFSVRIGACCPEKSAPPTHRPHTDHTHTQSLSNGLACFGFSSSPLSLPCFDYMRSGFTSEK